jgi:hypothetical protein
MLILERDGTITSKRLRRRFFLRVSMIFTRGWRTGSVVPAAREALALPGSVWLP